MYYGGYDKLIKPNKISNQCDYFLITDVPPEVKIENDEFYKRIPISLVVPEELNNPKDQNRYCKMHGFQLFQEYDYSIYIDGSIRIIGDIVELINKVGKYGIAFHKCSFCNDVYEHAMSLSIRSRIKRKDACIEMKKLVQQGFPRFYSLAECGVIVSNHTNEMGRNILIEWNDYYNCALAKRDQLYLPYILWRHGIEIEEVCTLPGDLRTNGYFELISLHTGFQ